MSKKDYKKGMADAMSAYEAFGEKQEAAIRHVGAEIEKTAGKVDKLGGKIGEIADYITDKEKAELYKLNTPVDIADLEDAEKRILVAVLYQLSADEDEVTEEQQNYVRAVQQYLKIYNPQTEIDLEAVENIEDISAQKAVLQAALEFFRLGTHPEELTEEQEDFLDCFQVNRRTHREINSCIDAIVDAVGLRGLSEKYGFVASQPRSEFARYTDNGPIPEKVADFCISLLRTKPLCRFSNNLYFLETKDYLLYYQCPNGFHSNCGYRKEWDTKEALDVGFYCIEKRTGKMDRLKIDYKKDFPDSGPYHFQYCIHKNTVYVIANQDYNVKMGDNPLISIDLDKKEYHVLPFKCPEDKINYHISVNEMYLMVHGYRLRDEHEVLSTMTYIIDMTQGNRVFVLDHPGVIMRDAFLFENEIIFAGGKDEKDTLRLFQYNIKDKSVQEMFQFAEPEPKDLSSYRGNVCGEFFQNILINNNGLRTSQTNDVFREMWRVGDDYYFLVHSDTTETFDNWTYFRLFRKPSDGGKYTVQKIFSTDKGLKRPWILHTDQYALYYTDAYPKIKKYNFDTNEITNHIDSSCTSITLLGDYLYMEGYKRPTKKANVSKGWDNLQWEIMNFPD